MYYICGYVASKSGIGLNAPKTPKQFEASEFTQKVSRGFLKHPTDELYELAMVLFSYYKNVVDNSCCSLLLKAFHLIYESSPCHLDNPAEVLRCFVKCFLRDTRLKKTEEIKVDKQNRKNARNSNFAIHKYSLPME